MTKPPDLKEYGKRSAKCFHCGKRGRAKCKAGVCLNFCCCTKFYWDKAKEKS